MLTVATINVNGLRAAVRRGMQAWLADRSPDVLCLQEVRAPDDVVAAVAAELLPGWHRVHQESDAAGRAGVAILTRAVPEAVRTGLAGQAPGRWVELDLATSAGILTVISCYVHTGEAQTPRQDEKYRFLAAARSRLDQLIAEPPPAAGGDGGDSGGRQVLLCGDLNVAHREEDLKNWKGNLRKAGFLPQERAWFDELFAAGWVDVGRRLAGEGPGPYSWWSWRGKAFDLDSGWRIDYHLADAALAARAVKCEVDRAASYAQRWSDHAPVVAVYDLA